jgi:hypothetical protein
MIQSTAWKADSCLEPYMCRHERRLLDTVCIILYDANPGRFGEQQSKGKHVPCPIMLVISLSGSHRGPESGANPEDRNSPPLPLIVKF